MSAKAKRHRIAIVVAALLVGLVGWPLFMPKERPSLTSEFNAKPSSSAHSKGAIVLVAFRPLHSRGGHYEFSHDGVAKQEQALLLIPGVVNSKEPVIIVWSPECTVRDQWAFMGFASKFGIKAKHYIAPENGRTCLGLRAGDAFPSSRSDSFARKPNGSAFEVTFTSGRLVFNAGNTSRSLPELMEIARSGAPIGLPQNLDVYLDDNLPLVKLSQIDRSLSAITKNYRLLRDNGFYGTPMHVGESSIEYALRPYEAQK